MWCIFALGVYSSIGQTWWSLAVSSEQTDSSLKGLFYRWKFKDLYGMQQCLCWNCLAFILNGFSLMRIYILTASCNKLFLCDFFIICWVSLQCLVQYATQICGGEFSVIMTLYVSITFGFLIWIWTFFHGFHMTSKNGLW